MDHEPTVWPIEWGELLEFCNSAGYRCRLEPSGSLLIPPDYNVRGWAGLDGAGACGAGCELISGWGVRWPPHALAPLPQPSLLSLLPLLLTTNAAGGHD